MDIVVEVMGGLEPARSLILAAIAAGKPVVTANKAVIARYGEEIAAAAAEKGVYVLIEAAVGGGIPIIEPLLNPLWVLLFMGEVPSGLAMLGGAVVIAGVTVRSLLASRAHR